MLAFGRHALLTELSRSESGFDQVEIFTDLTFAAQLDDAAELYTYVA